MNRVRRTRQDIAGKGINVCVALKNMGLDPLCIGFNFAENGDILTSHLDALGIRHDFITIDGAIRTNIKLYEESGTMTELNQPGAFVPVLFQEELEMKLRSSAPFSPFSQVQSARHCEKQRDEAVQSSNEPLDCFTYARNDEKGILILSGSRPQGVPADFYARLCEAWIQSDSQNIVFFDTEGEALRLALESKAAPFAIKPNLFELESTFGVKLNSPQEIADFCRGEIMTPEKQNRPAVVCVSMGGDGAVLVTPTKSYFCPALGIEVRGVQGAGDAMVAGLVYAVTSNAPEAELLPHAMAAAAASVIRDGTEMCSRDDFDAMMTQARELVRKID